MRKPWGWGILLSVLACGCGDSPARVVRDAQTARNEFVDILLKVTDEESAKVVTAKDKEVDKVQKRWDDIKKRLDNRQKDIDKSAKKLKPRLPRILDDDQDTADELRAVQDTLMENGPEIKATAKRLGTQISRIKGIIEELRRKEIARGVSSINAEEKWPSLSKLLKMPDLFRSARVDPKTDLGFGAPPLFLDVSIPPR